MSEFFIPTQPRPREDPHASGIVQNNLEFFMQFFQKGLQDGDIMVWDQILGRYLAKPAGGVEVVNSIPAAPIPGQEIVLVDNVANPTFNWHLRYNADSLSLYKWECIGATPAFAIAAGDATGLLNGSYLDTPGGPTFTLPVSGDFIITITGCIVVTCLGGDVDRANLSYRLGATPASDTWSVRVEVGRADFTEVGVTGSQTYRHTGLSSGTQIVAQDRQNGGDHHAVLGARTLTVTPIRVG